LSAFVIATGVSPAALIFSPFSSTFNPSVKLWILPVVSQDHFGHTTLILKEVLLSPIYSSPSPTVVKPGTGAI